MRGDDHLRPFLQAGQAAPEDEAGLPPREGGEYRPHSPPANKPVFALHLIQPGGRIRTFQYSDLDSDSSYGPEEIRLRFSGTRVMEVVIRGRCLWRLYDSLHRQVIRWVMQATQDFARDGECIVSRIDVAAVRQPAAGTPPVEEVPLRRPMLVD